MQLADPGLGVDDAVPDSEAEMDHSFTPTRLEREGAQADPLSPVNDSSSSAAATKATDSSLTIKLPAPHPSSPSSNSDIEIYGTSTRPKIVKRGRSKLGGSPLILDSSSASSNQSSNSHPSNSASSNSKANTSAKSRATDDLADARAQNAADSDADDDYQEGREVQDGRWNKGKKKFQLAANKNAKTATNTKKRRASALIIPSDDEEEQEEAKHPLPPRKKPRPKPKPVSRKSKAAGAAAAPPAPGPSLHVRPWKPSSVTDSNECDASREHDSSRHTDSQELQLQRRETTGGTPQTEPNKSIVKQVQGRGKKRARDSAIVLPSTSPASSPHSSTRPSQADSPASKSPARSERSASEQRQSAAMVAQVDEGQAANQSTIHLQTAVAPKGKAAKGRASTSGTRNLRMTDSDSEGETTEPLRESSDSELSEEEQELPPEKESAIQSKKTSVTSKGQDAATRQSSVAEQQDQQQKAIEGDEARATNGVLPEGEVAGCQALVTHRPRESISPLASTSNALVCRSTSNKVGKVGSGKTKPGSLADIMSRTVPTGLRMPGLSKSQRIPHLHKSINPPPPKKAIPRTEKKWDSDDDGEEWLSQKEIARRKRVDDGDESPTEEDTRRLKRLQRYKDNGWKG